MRSNCDTALREFDLKIVKEGAINGVGAQTILNNFVQFETTLIVLDKKMLLLTWPADFRALQAVVVFLEDFDIKVQIIPGVFEQVIVDLCKLSVATFHHAFPSVGKNSFL